MTATTKVSVKQTDQGTRRARVGAEFLIAEQRCRMFRDNDLQCMVSWEALEHESATWLRKHLADESYTGWLTEENNETIAGAGVWFMEWPPHFLHDEPLRAYLMNFYVAPHARGRGLVRQLMDLAITECRRRRVRVAVLHASRMGLPVYEDLGWDISNEMMMRLVDRPI